MTRGLVGLVIAGLFLADPGAVTLTRDTRATTAFATAGVLVVVALLDLGLGTATFFGRNWARVLLMLSCAITIGAAFLATARGGPRPTLGTDLPHVALGILVLLALTSPAARQYATRGWTIPKQRSGGLEPPAVP